MFINFKKDTKIAQEITKHQVIRKFNILKTVKMNEKLYFILQNDVQLRYIYDHSFMLKYLHNKKYKFLSDKSLNFRQILSLKSLKR